ncbi:MAG: serine protein kinase [Deltaproteobacteria bacterium]|nr:MAG: serine protein kinase [Deltaproteobacteria bacterium]TMA75799.1 MAG: serine protein kinase [Deltaproteobacteria bacterium]
MPTLRESGDMNLVSRIAALQDKTSFKELHWDGSFEDYLKIVRENPRVTRTAFQRIYDMILSHGKTEYIDNKKRLIRYHFFHDEPNGGRDAVYGLDVPLMKLVNVFKSAAQAYGTEKRVILLHGPVGSSKSTIVRLLKKGLEEYSRTPEGALYTFSWVLEKKRDDGTVHREVFNSPMNEDPLLLIPEEWREKVFADLASPDSGFQVPVRGDLCPASRLIFRELMTEYKGDFAKVMSHVRVRRLLLSEKDRIGIGTFQPKDEKNQDSTELTGDVNYRKIAEYGSDSDPRAFNFDGEFNIANRGIIEFVEVLKLDVAFLYDLLGASQEHRIKPKKFPQTDIDEVIIGHTNEPEYKKLQNNEFMEALRDRTVKIDIPYITKLNEEVKIYEKDYNSHKIRGKHIAPHTLEMAAMWCVLTRLEEPKKHNLTLLQKLKLYNGKTLPGFTEDNIKELRKEANREGMEGISPRYVQDKISNALVSDKGEGCVNPFMVLNELESGLRHHSLISSEEVRKRDRELLSVVKGEYEDIVKNEVQRAISADEDAIAKLCGNYIDNIKAYTQREKVRNKYTGQYEEPDERLMRAIEEKIDIPESRKDDFRREIMNYIGALAIEGKTFNYRTNERLHKALELKLFEDQKDSIKLKNLVSSVVDKDTQEKIDIVKDRMIKSYGYCEICSTDVLNFVASIFARGDAKD